MRLTISETLFKEMCKSSVLKGHGRMIDLDRVRQSKAHVFRAQIVQLNRIKTSFGETNRCLIVFYVDRASSVKEFIDIDDALMKEVVGEQDSVR
jgi:hypothetical protein